MQTDRQTHIQIKFVGVYIQSTDCDDEYQINITIAKSYFQTYPIKHQSHSSSGVLVDGNDVFIEQNFLGFWVDGGKINGHEERGG